MEKLVDLHKSYVESTLSVDENKIGKPISNTDFSKFRIFSPAIM